MNNTGIPPSSGILHISFHKFLKELPANFENGRDKDPKQIGDLGCAMVANRQIIYVWKVVEHLCLFDRK
jgi:hypothetical protein